MNVPNISKNAKGVPTHIDNEQIKFAHFRIPDGDNVSPCGGATVAYLGDKENIKVAGVAYCSDLDNFNYIYGRTKAIGRLVQGIVNDLPGDDPVEETFALTPKFLKQWTREEVVSQMDVLGYERW